MKKLFLLLLFVSLRQIASAQDLPKILPSSPQSQQFFKQFEFPANNVNGTINYNVPIYEVRSGSLSLPVSLSYVSGGTKMADAAGEIGLGWSLNAGGRIARTIYGKPDYNMPDSVPTANNGDGNMTNSFYYYLYNIMIPATPMIPSSTFIHIVLIIPAVSSSINSNLKLAPMNSSRT